MNADNIVELSGSDLTYLLRVMVTAAENNQRIRIYTDSNGLKVARGGSMWTLSFGKTI